MTTRVLLTALAGLALSGHAAAVTLYANDFDGGVVVDGGVGVAGFTNGGLDTATAGVWNADGWSGSVFRNASTGNPALLSELTLSNLAPHSAVEIDFLLGLLESWDSSDGGCCAPDWLDIYIDGSLVGSLTTNNALGTVEDYDGGTELYEGVQINTASYYYSDALIDMSTAGFLSFAHTGSTLTLGLQARGAGWQGGSDESWGIDSLQISYDGQRSEVPVPGTLPLLGIGLAGLGLARRRR